MSAAVLYRAFGIREYKYLATHWSGDEALIEIRHDESSLRCSACGSYKVTKSGTVTRAFLHLPLGRKMGGLVLEVQRMKCEEYGGHPLLLVEALAIGVASAEDLVEEAHLFPSMSAVALRRILLHQASYTQ